MRPASSSRAARSIAARRVVANVNPKLLFERLVAPAARRRRFPRAHRRLPLRLGHVPDERRARRRCPISRACRRRDAQPHHASGIIMAPSLGYMERAYFDAKTAGWSREPIVEILIPVDGRRFARAARACTSRACSASTCIRICQRCGRARRWDDARDEVADLMIATVDRVAPEFRAQACSVAARCRRSTSSASSASIGGDIFHGALRSTSSSRRGRCSATPTTGCRCRVSTCADRARIRAAA